MAVGEHRHRLPRVSSSPPEKETPPDASPSAVAKPQDTSNAHKDVCSYLLAIYKGFPTGFAVDHGGKNMDCSNLQYGEITHEGMETLHNFLQLGSEDVFYDLGSGVGKFVLYVALRGLVGKSKGIEVGERRHVLAQDAVDRLSGQLQASEADRAPSLPTLPRYSLYECILGDCRDNIFSDATVIALSNLCMDCTVQNRCVEQILKCPLLRTLVCTAPLPPHSRLRFLRCVHVGCTWAKVTAWQVYELLPAIVKSALHPMQPIRRRTRLGPKLGDAPGVPPSSEASFASPSGGARVLAPPRDASAPRQLRSCGAVSGPGARAVRGPVGAAAAAAAAPSASAYPVGTAVAVVRGREEPGQLRIIPSAPGSVPTTRRAVLPAPRVSSNPCLVKAPI